MDKYKYTAISSGGKKLRGTLLAGSEEELASMLSLAGAHLTSARKFSGTGGALTLGSGVGIREIASFCRRFAIMQGAFIPLPESLELLRNQTTNDALGHALDEIYKDVTGGAFLSEAMRKHKKIFPDFMCSMIYVGEMSGNIDVVLSSLADYYEREVKTRRKFRSALAYPTIIFVMTLALACVMLLFIVPTFKDSLAELGVELTGLTAAVYRASDFMLEYGYLVFLAIFAVTALAVLFFNTERGRRVGDKLVLKIPLINRVLRNIHAARIARSLGLLISSGMGLDEALSASEIVITNSFIKAKYADAANAVRRGESLASALGKQGVFPDTMIKMIEVGEETNSLDDVLLRSCAFLDLESENSLSSLSSAIGPVMLVIMGAVIGVLFFAVYSPILSVISAF